MTQILGPLFGSLGPVFSRNSGTEELTATKPLFEEQFSSKARRNCVREVRLQLESSLIAGVISDLSRPDQPIIACNNAFERLTGYDASEIIGRNCRFLSRGTLNNEQSRRFRKAISRNTSCVIEVMNYRKDGTQFLNGVTLSPIFGRDGEPVAMLGSQIDLTNYDPQCHLHKYHRARSKLAELTKRKREVIIAMAKGMLIKEISFKLGICERTVKLHRAEAIKALGLRNPIEAVRLAIEAGY